MHNLSKVPHHPWSGHDCRSNGHAWKHYETSCHASRLIHGCSKLLAAVARVWGSNSSIGRRKSAKSLASLGSHSYFSTSTSVIPQGLSLVMWRSSPENITRWITLCANTYKLLLCIWAGRRRRKLESPPMPSPVKLNFRVIVQMNHTSTRWEGKACLGCKEKVYTQNSWSTALTIIMVQTKGPWTSMSFVQLFTPCEERDYGKKKKKKKKKKKEKIFNRTKHNWKLHLKTMFIPAVQSVNKEWATMGHGHWAACMLVQLATVQVIGLLIWHFQFEFEHDQRPVTLECVTGKR